MLASNVANVVQNDAINALLILHNRFEIMHLHTRFMHFFTLEIWQYAELNVTGTNRSSPDAAKSCIKEG